MVRSADMTGTYWGIFRDLEATALVSLLPGQLVVEQTSIEGHYVARDADGHAALLIETTGDLGIAKPSYRLRGVEAHLCVEVDVVGKSVRRTMTCAIIRSLDVGDLNTQYFLGICEAMAEIVGSSPSPALIADAIDRVMRIYAQLSGPARRSISGLLGELVFIANYPDTLAAVTGWRSNPRDRFDFVFENFRLDVKATSGKQRVHTVTFEQANPPADVIAYFASTFIESIPQGMTGSELLGVVLRKCSPSNEAQLKIQTIVSESMGEILVDFLASVFDYVLASKELKYFCARDIPAIRKPLEVGVTRVKFASDFSLIQNKYLPADEETGTMRK